MTRPARDLYPDLRALPLQDIMHAIRDIPFSSWLFTQLDSIYLERFLKAKTDADYSDLRAHISFMLTYFIPMHLVNVNGRHEYESRWATLAKLADERRKMFENPPVSGSPESAVLKLLASRESTEINLVEPLSEQERAAIDGMIERGYIERVGMDRPHPLRPQDYTLVITGIGRAALSR